MCIRDSGLIATEHAFLLTDVCLQDIKKTVSATSGILTCLERTKIVFRWGSAPDPAWGAHNAPRPPSRLGRETGTPVLAPRRLWGLGTAPSTVWRVICLGVGFGLCVLDSNTAITQGLRQYHSTDQHVISCVLSLCCFRDMARYLSKIANVSYTERVTPLRIHYRICGLNKTTEHCGYQAVKRFDDVFNCLGTNHK